MRKILIALALIFVCSGFFKVINAKESRMDNSEFTDVRRSRDISAERAALKVLADSKTEIELRAHTAVLSDEIEEMTDRDMQFHSTLTHTLYCSMEFSGVFKQIEIIKPVLIGMEGERILEKYSIPTVGSADISIAKSFLAKTDQQKRIFCDQLDKAFELSNKNTPASDS